MRSVLTKPPKGACILVLVCEGLTAAVWYAVCIEISQGMQQIPKCAFPISLVPNHALLGFEFLA